MHVGYIVKHMHRSPVLNEPLTNALARRADLLLRLARPTPLPVVNYFLRRAITKIIQKNPTLFKRLSGHHHKTFLIEITNLPFNLVLRPDPVSPYLSAQRKKSEIKANAKISGSFLRLLGMIDGQVDGDALFFTRDLQISGDTEAIVRLRNALDDVDGSVADEVASYFGVFGLHFLAVARRVTADNEHPA